MEPLQYHPDIGEQRLQGIVSTSTGVWHRICIPTPDSNCIFNTYSKLVTSFWCEFEEPLKKLHATSEPFKPAATKQ